MRRDEFYDERTTIGAQRKRSLEVDYGVMWKRDGIQFPLYRVAYVETTGEVICMPPHYAQRQSDSEVEILGQLKPNDKRDAEKALEGWVDHIHEDNGLGWIRTQIGRYNGHHDKPPKLERVVCPDCGSPELGVDTMSNGEQWVNCRACGQQAIIGPLTPIPLLGGYE